MRPAAAALALLAMAGMAWAQPREAEVAKIIEALRPSAGVAQGAASGAPERTRNIVVRPRAEAGAGVVPAADAAPRDAAAAPADAPSLASAKAAPSLSLPIAFEPNSARLRPESGAALGALTAAMLSPELREQRFVIEGHTDASGTREHNQRLSLQRAQEVRLYLVTLGVSGERLRAVGRGAEAPARADAPAAPENRRVRVLTLP